MAGLRIHVVMPPGLVAQIDAALTDGVSRGEFVRRAVERALSKAQGLPGCEQSGPDPVPSSEGVRPAAPAEQPCRQHVPGPDVTRLRSSGQAKRGVRPMPKGKRS